MNNDEVKGMKFDEGKLRFDLIPPEIELYLAEVLTYGANKYTRSHTFTKLEEVNIWLQKNNLQNVIQIDQSSVGECVEVVMKRIYVKQILNTLIDNEKINVNGLNPTLNELKNTLNVEQIIQNIENEINKNTNKITLAENLDYLLNVLKNLKEYKEMLVQSVEEYWIQSKQFILTITTIQDNIEEYYVVNATTVLDSLTMMFNYLQKQLPTCKPLQELKCSGANNWKKISIDRYIAALRRHFNAWQLGEDNDSESSMHHLKHALTCLSFITWLELNKPKG